MHLISSIFRHGFPMERLLLSAFLLSVFGAVSIAISMSFLQKTLLAAETEESNLAQMEFSIVLTSSALKDLEIAERDYLLKRSRHRTQSSFDETKEILRLKIKEMADSYSESKDLDSRTSIGVISGFMHKRIDELSDSLRPTGRTNGVHQTDALIQSAVERLTKKLSSQRRYLDEQAQHYGQQMVRAVSAACALVVIALVIAYSFIYLEVRARREAAAAEAHAARHDLLTGLPNRALFLEWMNHVLANAKREAGTPSLIYIDLDGFKAINDSLGHKAGDQVLEVVASRLRGAVREGEMVARLGGDEFAVLSPSVHDASEAHVLAQRLIDTLGETILYDGKQLNIGASVGIAISDKIDVSPAALIAAADEAMYRAKKEGKNRFSSSSLSDRCIRESNDDA